MSPPGVFPPPDVFPLLAPFPGEPGFAPAPAVSDPSIFVPPSDPSVGVPVGKGAGPVDAPPVRIDADTPPGDTEEPTATASPEPPEPLPGVPEPAGKLSRVDDKFLKRHGIDPHEVKDENDLRPPSFFDIYLDQNDNMFGVRKGTDPKFGQFLGSLGDG